MVGTAASVFTNPAGLAPIRVMALEGAWAPMTDTSNVFTGAAAARIGSVNVGAGLRYLRFDDGLATERNIHSVGAMVVRIRGVALGLAADYASVEDSAGTVTRTLSGDAALTVAFFDIAALALAARHIGRTGFGGPVLDLPSTVSLGFSLNLIDTYSNGRLLATIEQVWGDGGARTRLGLEGGFVLAGVGVVGRAGTGGTADDSQFGDSTVGGSLVLGRAALDYAYLHRPEQSPVHMIGIRVTP